MKDAKVIELEEVTIRFSGDSGDGMQLTGSLFSDTTALFGNDISTFPITLPKSGPSGNSWRCIWFQVQFGKKKLPRPAIMRTY
jgi:2-oxoglutarate ferredoxin oxidoreductase subunit alpha